MIGAGKGGVGKSTLTLNLALSLAARGYGIGVLDADLYGPSLPMMIGARELSPQVTENKIVKPFEKFGIHFISLGFFLEESRSIVWRGPMLHAMLDKLLTQVAWPKLDFFLIDLPPGTGDIPISLQKLAKIDGSLVITTPQEIAFLDVRKAVHAFDLLNIPTLGLIENMVGTFFGQGRGHEFAARLQTEFLGSIPMEAKISKSCDLGIPFCFYAENQVIFKPLVDNLLTRYGENSKEK